MHSTAKLWVAHLSTPSELAAIRSDWNRLAAGVPFRSYEWLRSWWHVYGGPLGGKSRELHVLAVFHPDGMLLGIAPWYLQRTASHRVLRFLGAGEACSEYATVLSERGFEQEVAATLAEYLTGRSRHSHDPLDRGRRWDRIDLKGIYSEDQTLSALVRRLAERGSLIYRRPAENCWRIQLPTTWDAYLARLSKSHRKQMRKLQRRLLDTGRARLHVARNEEELDYGLALLERLNRCRRASLGDRGCFASPRFSEFHRLVTRRLLATGALRMYWLTVDNRPVAAEYQIVGEDVVYAYQSGIDPRALDCEPGRLIMLATLREAIAEGRLACDLLRGDELYKAHWRATPRPALDIRILRGTGADRFWHAWWIASDWFKAGVRRGMQLIGRSTNRSVKTVEIEPEPLDESLEAGESRRVESAVAGMDD